MGFNFPNTPAIGDTYNPTGLATYVWNGSVWTLASTTPPQAGNFKISEGGPLAAGIANFDITIPTTGYGNLEVYLNDLQCSSYQTLYGMFSWDGGATWPAAANQYYYAYDGIGTANAGGNYAAAAGTSTAMVLGIVMTSGAAKKAMAKIDIPVIESGGFCSIRSSCDMYASTEYRWLRCWGMSALVTAAPNRFRVLVSAGTFNAGAKWQLNGIK